MVASFELIPGIGVGFAVLTVVSRCIGAGDYEAARYYTKKLLKVAYAALIALNIIVVMILPLIIQVYHLSPEHRRDHDTREIIYDPGTCDP